MSGHLILGKDTANNKYVPISVDSSGHLDIDVQVADLDSKMMASETGATDGQQRQARCNTSGELLVNLGSSTTQNVNCFGKDGGGTPRELLVESNGAFVLGGGSVSALGNTIVDGSGDAKFLLCDAQGHLQVDIVSGGGGGGDASAANQTTQITNQGTINTSLGTVNTSVGTVNSTLGDTNSKIDAMRGTSDLGVINTSLGTVNSSIGDTNSKIDAMRGTSDLGVINTSLGTVNTSIGTSNSTLTDIEAHQGNIENNLSSIQSTVSSNKLQVDVITSALPSGAATETTLAAAEVHLGNIDGNITACNTGAVVISSNSDTTKATSTNQATMITHLSEIEGAVETIETCVSGTELQVDVRNRTDSAPTALTFTAGNTIIGASGITATAAIDVGGCSNYSIMLNMLTATANSADLLSCKVIIEYSPDDGSTFMGTVSASGGGAPESIVPAALYEPTGGSASTIIGYGVYVVPTLNMTAPTAGTARTNKIRIKVQNNSSNALTLDKFSIYKFN